MHLEKIIVAASAIFAASIAMAESAPKAVDSLQTGVKFKAVCDLAFSSGAQYMSFQGCVFK